MRTLPRNSRGFTLVELMAALLISMVGILALLQLVGTASEQNVRNSMRDEGTRLAEQQMGSLMARPYAEISTAVKSVAVTSEMRGIPRHFTITWHSDEVASLPGTTNLTPTKDVAVHIAWAYKNVSTSHEVHTIRACGQPQDSCP